MPVHVASKLVINYIIWFKKRTYTPIAPTNAVNPGIFAEYENNKKLCFDFTTYIQEVCPSLKHT